MKKNLLFFIGLFLLVFFIYFPSISGFFQHDEWSTFAQLIVLKRQGLESIVKFLVWPDVAHYAPITKLVFFLEFIFFKLNFTGYILLSISFHLITIYLVYLLTREITKNFRLSVIATFVFAISLASYQSVTWVGASAITEVSVIFALLSFIFFVRKKLSLSFLFWFLSMLSKETAIALPLVFVAYNIIFEKDWKKDLKKHISTPIFPLIMYIFLRFSFFFVPNPTGTDFVATRTQSLFEILYNLISFPVKIFSQSVIPQRSLIYISRSLGNVFGITSETVIQTSISEIISYFVFITCLVGIFYFRRKINKKYLKPLILGVFFVILNSFIYAFSPGRVGVITLVDSRNLYFPMVGISIVFSVVLYNLFKISKYYAFALLGLIVLVNLPVLSSDFPKIAEVGNQRKQIISTILMQNQSLANKTVFYIESDKSFYGMPDNVKIPPFETGLGQILLIEYADKMNYPNEFYEGHFLEKITDEGYIEKNEKGFGYFINFEDLEAAYKKYRFTKDIIVAFRYDSGLDKLSDITVEIRARLN